MLLLDLHYCSYARAAWAMRASRLLHISTLGPEAFLILLVPLHSSCKALYSITVHIMFIINNI